MPRIELGRILDDLDAVGEMFEMGKDRLGERLCKAATDGIKATIAAEQAPDGTPWAPLSAAYDEWKQASFPGQPMAHLHDVMADDYEVEGEVAVTPTSAEVTYGRSQVARDEAAWFQEGSAENNQPPRPFFDFTGDSLDAIAQILDDRFDIIK